jgi:hypothetical protein
MKINKESLIKIFENGLGKIMIDQGDYGSLSVTEGYYAGRGIDMGFNLRTEYDLLGYIRLCTIYDSKESFEKIGTSDQWIHFGIKYILSFTPYAELPYNAITVSSSRPMEKDVEEFMHELSSDEFVKLAIKFKKSVTTANKLSSDIRQAELNRKLEIMSDDYGLDFFPKKRKVIVEKTIAESESNRWKIPANAQYVG